MTLDLPNLADAAFPGQARLYASDLVILGAPASLSGVKTGCAVTAQGSPNMTLAVASGTIYWLNAEVTVTAGNVIVTAANATNDRIDLVVANSSGTKSVVAGTPATIPLQPALPASSVALAQVYVPANDTAIGSTQVRDRRVILQIPSVAGASTLVRKTADESVTSSTTLQDDNHLFFAMTSNGRWAFKIVVLAASAAGTTMNLNLSAPAGAVWRYQATLPAANTAARASDGSNSDVQNAGTTTIGADTIVLDGVVTTAATSGNLQFRWCQAVSSATALRVLTNSYLEYRAL